MANTLKLKQSAVSAKIPTTAQLQLGELAVNTYDGRLFTKKNNGTESIVEFISNAGTWSISITGNAATVGGKAIGTSGNTLPLLDAANTWSQPQTFSTGLKPGATSWPVYSTNIDFGADGAGVWRKIVTVACVNGTYSTVAFKIDVVDANTNHGTDGSVSPDIETYFVACQRTLATVLDTPDLCLVRGPSNRVRAVKTATGQYEIQIQPDAQYREYLVSFCVTTANQAHTITYHDGSTVGATGTAQYNASIGDSVTHVETLKAWKGITCNATTLCTNLNADLLDGLHADRFLRTVGDKTVGEDWDLLCDGAYEAGILQVINDTTSTNGPGNYGYGQVWASRTEGHNLQLYASHIASRAGTDGLMFRTGWNNSWHGWAKLWSSNNDGSGSGLDADLLDGYHVGTSGGTIPLLNAANTWSSPQTFTNGNFLLAHGGSAPTAMFRYDGTNFFILLSDAGSTPSSTYNALRPFRVSLTTGAVTLAEGLTLTRAWDGATGSGTLLLDNATANRIDWRAAGVGAPTTSTRSEGTKAVLYPALGASTVDYALGYNTNTFWTSIPQQTGRCFKQYAGTTPIAALHGDGTPFVYQAAPVTQDTSATLTAAQIRNGLVTSTPTAAITLTLPTGANTTDTLWDANLAIDWSVINLATDSARTVTLASNTTHSITGNAVVAANSSARFRTYNTGYEQNGNPVFATYRIS